MNEHSQKTRRPPPDAARWSAIEKAFDEAGSLSDAERGAFLGALEREDRSLWEEVNELLAARGPWWIDEPIGTLPPPPEQAGDRIGTYELIRPLGRGGMGDVWLAVREGTDFRQHVALKIIRPGMESAELRAALRAERQILGSLNHPNIAHLLDIGDTSDGRPYLVLEHVEGVPVTEYCNAHRLSIDDRLRLFRTVCDAVRHAHQSLVIHHDLKPSNVLVTKEGVPKLLDFGVAKVLSPEFGAGPRLRPSGHARLFHAVAAAAALTPGYAAPEQLDSRPTTTATDIYALGVVLYELLAGHRPYHTAGRTRSELLQMIEAGNVKSPSEAVAGSSADDAASIATARRTTPARHVRQLAGDLDAIVRHAMAVRPDERYSSVEQLSNDIGRALELRPLHARPRAVSYVADRFVRRHRLGVSVAIASVIVLAAFLTTVFRQSIAIREQAAQVERQREGAVAVSSFLRQLFRGADPGDARGTTITARELLDRGAERVEQLSSQPATQADLMIVMSDIYQDLGLYDRAEHLAAEAEARARHVGNDSLLVTAIVAHGKALHWKGDAKAAESRYREALAILRRTRDTAGAEFVGAMIYLGAALADEGDAASAERAYRSAITLERSRGAANDTLLALALSNLGVTLRRKGDLPGAETAHREALAIRRSVLGDDHPESIRSLNNVAVVVGARGNLAAAESLLSDVVDRWKRVLGATHPSVADALNTLGSVHVRTNTPRQAIPYYEESLKIRRDRLGPKSPAVAQSLFNLGVALTNAGDTAGALAHYREALAIRIEALGHNDETVKATQDAIAKLRGK